MDDIARCMQRINDLESELRRHRKGARIAVIGALMIGLVAVGSGQSQRPPIRQKPGEARGGKNPEQAGGYHFEQFGGLSGAGVPLQGGGYQRPGINPIEVRHPATSASSEVAMNTHSLRIVDANNKVRMVLSTYEDDKQPYLALYDAGGNERLLVCLDNEGRGSVGVHDGDGKNAIMLGLDESGSAAVVVKAEGIDKAGIGSRANAGRIWWRDEQNAELLPVAKEAKP